MASHSKQVLLDLLKKGTVRHGWGGVVALERTLLNIELREQFLEALGERTFVEPIMLEADLDESEQVSVSLQGVIFGEPQISFVKTRLSSADVTVRLNVIAGDFLRSVKQVARPARVVESFSITEGMGYWVQAQASLCLEQGSTHRFTSVVLDLGAMEEVTTNLGSTDYANRALGRELQETFGYVPAYRRTYSLVRFDTRDYAPLSPERMLLRTQAAPWAADPGKGREGDGALLVFMKLGVDVRAGGQPDPAFDFPYPIPEEATGIPGALILDPTIEPLGAGGPPQVLHTIRLASGHVFSATDAHKPLDWIIFGAWRPGEKSLAVEPVVASVRAAQQQDFKLQGAPGPVSWQARNLLRPGVSGAFQGSTYTARGTGGFAQDQQLVVVTARYPQGAGEGVRHALVVEQAQAVSVAPRVASWVQGQSDIDLRAQSVDGGVLEWELIDEPLGVLTDLGGGRATFKPHTPDSALPSILVQHILVTDKTSGESTKCSVVVIAWAADLVIEPGHVGQLQSATPIAFSVSNSRRKISWEIFGEGEIDPETGVYTPPEASTLPVCIIMADDGDGRTGYAMVEFLQRSESLAHKASWTDLATFELHVIGHDTCYANGWQQVEIEVRVEAQDGGGQPVEISDADLATLQLRAEGWDNEFPFLSTDEEGISVESGVTWAVSRARNKVDPPAVTDTVAAPAMRMNERRVRFYVHTRQATTLELYAGIQNAETFVWKYSNVSDAGKVKVTGRTVPNFSRQQYEFERVRIAAESENSPVAGDHFIYVDNTMDYWRLKSVIHNGQSRKFISMIIAPGANKSLLRWASEQFNDHYCSYTGLQFIPLKEPEAEHLRLYMDGLLYRLAHQRGHALPLLKAELGARAGELMISLRRTDAMQFWDDRSTQLPYQAHLRHAINLELIDQQGNQHKLRFDFGVPEGEDKEAQERDCLILTV
ncbi:hypothetical protein [Pseudomonas putida]|uniref:hypothetical protein n=1 Tax=Pseudomonas putida TaxID=303 RepID=UPI00216851AF|nr:hypothetical protein [Pseudomonas putida]MCS4065534.1 hypothetical protein [Pseudomonas putida]